NSCSHHVPGVPEVHTVIRWHGPHDHKQRTGEYQLPCVCRFITAPMGCGCSAGTAPNAAQQFHVPEESHFGFDKDQTIDHSCKTESQPRVTLGPPPEPSCGATTKVYEHSIHLIRQCQSCIPHYEPTQCN